MATMKTAEELRGVAEIVDDISKDAHAEAAVCMKCGAVIYALSPDWAERQCWCDWQPIRPRHVGEGKGLL